MADEEGNEQKMDVDEQPSSTPEGHHKKLKKKKKKKDKKHRHHKVNRVSRVFPKPKIELNS
jgi:hypothetical protein